MRAWPLGIVLAAYLVFTPTCLANATDRLSLVGIVAVAFRTSPG